MDTVIQRGGRSPNSALYNSRNCSVTICCGNLHAKQGEISIYPIMYWDGWGEETSMELFLTLFATD